MTKLVLLVDDNRQMRQALRMLFESEPDFEVAGEAEHGQGAIEKAEVLTPHLIILDFSMPVMNGLEAALILRKKLRRRGCQSVPVEVPPTPTLPVRGQPETIF